MSNFGEQINLVLNNLASKLNITVDMLYPCLLKQAKIEGIIALVYIILGCVAILTTFFVIYYFTIKKTENHTTYDDKNILVTKSYLWDDVSIVLFYMIIGIIVIILISIILYNTENYITATYNSEYYVLNKILTQLK